MGIGGTPSEEPVRTLKHSYQEHPEGFPGGCSGNSKANWTEEMSEIIKLCAAGVQSADIIGLGSWLTDALSVAAASRATACVRRGPTRA